MTEKEIQNQILQLSRGKTRLFRNNVGFDATNKVKYGLAPGSSDLIGWTQRAITTDDVGTTVAVFTAIEVKKPGGRVSDKQKTFINAVNTSGGIADVCYSLHDAVTLLS